VDELENNADVFSKTLTIFDDAVEISNPASDGFSLDVALAYVPLSHGMKSRVMAGELKLVVIFSKQTCLSRIYYISGYPSLHAACKDGYIYGVTDSPVQKNIDKLSTESHSSEILTKNPEQIVSELKEKTTEVS